MRLTTVRFGSRTISELETPGFAAPPHGGCALVGNHGATTRPPGAQFHISLRPEIARRYSAHCGRSEKKNEANAR